MTKKEIRRIESSFSIGINTFLSRILIDSEQVKVLQAGRFNKQNKPEVVRVKKQNQL